MPFTHHTLITCHSHITCHSLIVWSPNQNEIRLIRNSTPTWIQTEVNF